MLVPPSSSRLCWATNLRRRTGSWRERATRRQAELATLRSQQLLLAQQATDSRQLVVEMATTRRGRGRRGRLRPNANANAVAAVGGERGLGMGAPRHRVHGGGGGGSAPAAPCSSSARRRGRVGGGGGAAHAAMRPLVLAAGTGATVGAGAMLAIESGVLPEIASP
jgi:hypothetical protein